MPVSKFAQNDARHSARRLSSLNDALTNASTIVSRGRSVSSSSASAFARVIPSPSSSSSLSSSTRANAEASFASSPPSSPPPKNIPSVSFNTLAVTTSPSSISPSCSSNGCSVYPSHTHDPKHAGVQSSGRSHVPVPSDAPAPAPAPTATHSLARSPISSTHAHSTYARSIAPYTCANIAIEVYPTVSFSPDANPRARAPQRSSAA